jgi:hypothetical protein
MTRPISGYPLTLPYAATPHAVLISLALKPGSTFAIKRVPNSGRPHYIRRLPSRVRIVPEEAADLGSIPS